jgi:hypothetical protein
VLNRTGSLGRAIDASIRVAGRRVRSPRLEKTVSMIFRTRHAQGRGLYVSVLVLAALTCLAFWALIGYLLSLR